MKSETDNSDHPDSEPYLAQDSEPAAGKGIRIYLIGFMGAGKTTLGKYAARHLGLSFMDLDVQIETRAGKTIPEIFDALGETGFREAEQAALHASGDLEGDWLIATGGGTPCFFDNMAWMNAQGVTVYLSMGPARLADRLKHAKAERPLLKTIQGELKEWIAGKLAEREGYYRQAQVIVPEGKANKQAFREVLAEWLGSKGNR